MVQQLLVELILREYCKTLRNRVLSVNTVEPVRVEAAELQAVSVQHLAAVALLVPAAAVLLVLLDHLPAEPAACVPMRALVEVERSVVVELVLQNLYERLVSPRVPKVATMERLVVPTMATMALPKTVALVSLMTASLHEVAVGEQSCFPKRMFRIVDSS